ncbi:MAG: hypothetical protein GC180_01820 [Bacteroidetes bacterium]|nr:hypothetical protein [Bacteroidota bacterium]
MENENNASVMSVKDWVITLLITAIPLVGFIMLFVWAFSDGGNPNKANWAKAALIMIAIGVVLYFILFVMLGVAFMAAGSQHGGM